MSDFRERIPDDDREVPLDDEDDLELPPATLDPLESIEDDTDDLTDEERAAAIEAGEIEP
ncbi:hypothetical protein ABZ477_18005 [Microbacterium sp. NPDC019599]|uniref:hypothetical protein n=1 Tax=Microbacterium sp. NPDC019599 TaxID=3154690 RepID=UPI0034022237